MWEDRTAAPGARAEHSVIWRRFAALAGPAVVERLDRYDKALSACSPKEPYWYLGVLATHPERRLSGLATAALSPVLERADRERTLCCLETSTLANRSFYERRGFTQASDVDLAGGPSTWWLMRPPRS